MSQAADLLDTARARKLRLAAAESCTGGLVAAAITDIPGSSDVFERGFVTYSNAAKVEMLGVLRETLDTHGAVSEEVASEMARGAVARSGAEIAVAITGIAGPGGSETKPEGRVCFALAGPSGVRAETREFGPQGRAEVRAAATAHALHLLQEAVAGAPDQP